MNRHVPGGSHCDFIDRIILDELILAVLANEDVCNLEASYLIEPWKLVAQVLDKLVTVASSPSGRHVRCPNALEEFLETALSLCVPD